ncbi:MAG: PD-(D/E)XK nuclease family protein [Firmicutes bacterium]|nr:PD-(D/E)XK nuclease family protein [Bacillota bacterium]
MISRSDLSKSDTDDAARITEVEKEMAEGFPDFIDTEGYMELIQQRFEFQYPYKDDVASKSKFAVSELNRMLKMSSEESSQYFRNPEMSSDPEEVVADEISENPLAQSLRQRVPSFMKAEEPVTAMMRGTLVHKVLELIPFAEGVGGADVKAFVEKLVAEGRMEEREAQVVDVRKIVSFFESEIGRRACRAEFLKKEWAFTLRKDREEIAAMAADAETADLMRQELPEKLLIQGIIDCCFRDEQGLVIIDYKTDWVDKSNKAASIKRLKESYKNQLSLYKEVVEKALGEPVVTTALFLIDSGDVVEI